MKNDSIAQRRKGLWLSISALGLIGALVGTLPLSSGTHASVNGDNGAQTDHVTRSHQPGFENYDIRTDKNAAEKIEAFRAASGKNALNIASSRNKMVAGEDSLRSRVPTLKVEYNDDLRVPEVIAPDVKKGVNFLTGANSGKNSETLRRFVKDNNSLVGLNDNQADNLRVTADYTNPDGMLSFAHLEQFINDIPVFRGEIKAGFTKRGEMIRVINNLAPEVDYSSASTNFGDPAEAVRIAFKNVSRQMKAEDTEFNSAESNDLKVKFGTGDWATTAEKMYFPIESGIAVSAWRVLIWEPVSAYYVIVDANTGTMLWRKNITEDQTQTATYQVYTNPLAMINSADSPAPLTPGPISPTLGTQGAIIASRTNITRIGNEAPYTFNNNGWITDGANITDGNAVEAGIDRVAPNGVDGPVVGNPNRVFDSTWNPPPGNPAPGDDPLTAQAQRGAVIQMFYVMNLYHDELYRLGFTEPAFNFQNDNFGRGGAGADRVSAEGQDSSGTDNANFSTPADGGRGRMQMFLWTGPTPDYDGTTDVDVVIHEVTHGTSNRLHGNTTGLGSNMSRGMGEGWSDFYAHSLLSQQSDPINGIYTTGGYATNLITGGFTANYYYGIRRFPKAVMAFTGPNGKPHNPYTFRYVNSDCNTLIGTTSTNPNSAYPRGPIGVSQCDQVHNLGEVWSTALWEARAKFVTRLGWATGNRKMLQFVTDGMKLAPLNPTFLTERDAIIAAAQASGTAADVADLWEGFRIRGMGFGASIQSVSPAAVTENFDPPNVVMVNPFSVSDVTGDNDGFPEPGESILLSVAVTNNTGSTINNVQVSIAGGGTLNYGTIANGATVVNNITYTVPAGATCGSLHDVSITVSSAAGTNQPQIRSFRLGAPVGGAPATFSNTAAITINDNAPATPYPSNITVSGLSGNKNIKLTLNGFSHTFPADVDILLVGPGGQKFVAMSDSGGTTPVSNVTFSLTDTAAAAVPAPVTAGDWKPTNADTTSDVFPAPAPAAPYNNPAPAGTATFASTFGTSGTPMNGTWSLYVRDDAGIDIGQIAGGWSLTFEANDYNCSIAPPSNTARLDFDNDGKTDVSVFRDGNWFVQRSTAGFAGVQWGAIGDTLVPTDYDSDGKTDYAIYRPTATAGVADFYVLNSATGTFTGVEWGTPTDVAVTGDFVGDSKADFAVYRSSNNSWYILPSGGGSPVSFSIPGTSSGGVPMAMDYDGDGKSDAAQVSDGNWFIRRSSNTTVQYVNWGVAGDKYVPADYDNDNKDDVAVFRNGLWVALRSTTNTALVANFGTTGDIPVPGDYDGDGTDDQAVYRGGNWFINRSSGGFQAVSFGISTDVPVPSVYTR